MSENILYKFAKDLSSLYARTHLRSIENHFIRIAQVLDIEIEKWLQKAVQSDIKNSLQKPEVLDTLILLARLKKSYPAGFSPSDFVKTIGFDDKLKHFLPIIVALREVSKSKDFAILSPYRSILESSGNISVDAYISSFIPSATSDINKLDNEFRVDLERTLTKTYDDGIGGSSKKRITKKEKINNLLHYLTRRFSEEISMSFEQIGQIDVFGIAQNSDVIMNPLDMIEKTFPNYPKQNLPIVIKWSKDIANQAIKYSDPEYYDYTYNYIRNKIMLYSAEITREQFDRFQYESVLKIHSFSRGDEATESESVPISADAWSVSHNIIFLSCILYLIASKNK